MPLSQRAPHASGSSACRADRLHGFAFERVLGTTLELTVIGPRVRAETACEAVLAEVARLEAVFSRFEPGSDLRRWLRSERVEPASELFDLLRRAEGWTDRTGGAFHPGAQAFGQLWAEAERRGVAPDADALAGLTASLRADFASGPPPAHAFGLDAIAKGRIVDALVEVSADVPDVEGVLVNVGGDLRAWGVCEAAVAVADPFVRADNAPTVATVHLRDAALATSGVRLQGYRVAGRWYPHLIDPRDGRPVEGVAGATVVAATCADADALATACCVLAPAQGLQLIEGLDRVGVLIWPTVGAHLVNDHFLARTPAGVRSRPRGPEHGRA